MPTSSREDQAANLAFDFPGVRIGTAEYADGPTGCTVLRFDRRAKMHIDPRGGAVCYAGSSRSAEAIGFALTTQEVPAGTIDPVSLSLLGGELACDAVLSITNTSGDPVVSK